MPVQSRIPPKHMAAKIMEIVHIIPCTLEEDNRSPSFSMTGDASSGTLPSEIPLFMMLNTLLMTLSPIAVSIAS